MNLALGQEPAVFSGPVKIIQNVLSIGTNPAQSGVIRIPNNQGVVARNAANTADITILSLNSSNQVSLDPGGQGTVVGGALTVSGLLTANAGGNNQVGGVTFNGGNVTCISVAASSLGTSGTWSSPSLSPLNLTTTLTGSLQQLANVAPTFQPGSSVLSATGIYLNPTASPGSGVTISNVYSIYAASGTKSGLGSVTKAYGLYINSPVIGTSNYAAYFGGNVGIGTDVPPASLTVNGGVYIGSAPADPGANNLQVQGNTTIGGNLVVSGTQNAFGSTAANVLLCINQSFAMSGSPRAVGIYSTLTPGTGFNLVGLEINPTLGSGTTSINEAYGIIIQPMPKGTTGTIGTVYGLRVAAQAATSTTAYGLYVDSPTGGTTNYGIYQAGTATNQFGGSLLVGATRSLTAYNAGGVYVGQSPADPGANNLTVQGNLRALGQASIGGTGILSDSTLAIGTPATGYGLTIIRVSGGNETRLRFHDQFFPNYSHAIGQFSGAGGAAFSVVGSDFASLAFAVVTDTGGAFGDIFGKAGSTTMTSGFIFIPAAGGAPTGTPTARSGRVPLYYDTTNNKLYVYNGGWKSVALA